MTITNHMLARLLGGGAAMATVAAFAIGGLITTSEASGGATCRGQQANIVGTAGRDVIDAGPGRDVIKARGGNDDIDAGSGRDLVCGGAGSEEIDGDADSDRLLGQRGNDEIDGQTGNDLLNGGRGRDNLDGEGGRDTCVRGEVVEDCERR